MVNSIGAVVRFTEVIHFWEGPLREVSLYRQMTERPDFIPQRVYFGPIAGLMTTAHFNNYVGSLNG